MEQDKMREEFEQAAIYKFGLPRLAIEKNQDGSYKAYSTDIYWRWWQASREAVVVELPPGPATCDMTSTMICNAMEDCRAAIHAAGIRTR